MAALQPYMQPFPDRFCVVANGTLEMFIVQYYIDISLAIQCLEDIFNDTAYLPRT